jgi:hypothetical protein
MARRSVFDPLEISKEPRWYVVRSVTGAVLEARVLPPGTDLKRPFVAAMLEWMDARDAWGVQLDGRCVLLYPGRRTEDGGDNAY